MTTIGNTTIGALRRFPTNRSDVQDWGFTVKVGDQVITIKRSTRGEAVASRAAHIEAAGRALMTEAS